jgi:hypothetical protein
MNFKKTTITVLPIFFFLPILAFAAGFVPCDGTSSNPCNFGSLITMVNSILQWFISIAFVLAAIGMTWSGAQIVINAGKPEELSKAKGMFFSIVKGTLFVAGAWLIVYTIMSVLANTSSGFNFLKYLK